MRHNAFARRLRHQKEVRKIRRHTGQSDTAVIDQLGKVVRRLPVFRKGAVDKHIHKIINCRRFARQPNLDRPANAEGVTIRILLLHFAQLFCKLNRQAEFLAPVKRVNADTESVCNQGQYFCVGRTAPLPFRHCLRCNAYHSSDLFLSKAVLHTVLFDLLSYNTHNQPSVDFLILL